MKLCRQCGNIKDLTKFSKNRSRPDGLNSYCKTCHSHKDPSTKTIESARLFMTGWKLDRINEELAKCEVLCANCHRKLHHATLA